MKKALVISGGGSKGAFSVGVLKQLQQTFPTRFDILVGTSTGALITPMAALGRITELEELYTTMSNDDILVKYNFGARVLDGAGSIFTFGPLKKIIAKIYDDHFFEELLQSGVKLYLTTVCLQTSELVVFTTDQNPPTGSYYRLRSLVNGEQFRRAVLASASQPVFTPAVKVDEKTPSFPYPYYQYVDGGVREYAGVMIAVEAGAAKIMTIIHSPEEDQPATAEFPSILPILQQTIDIFVTDVGKNDLYVPNLYNAGLNYIEKVKQNMRAKGVGEDLIHTYFTVSGGSEFFQNKVPLKIHTIRPESSLGGGPGGLNFDPEEMKGMLAKGASAFAVYAANYKDSDSFWV